MILDSNTTHSNFFDLFLKGLQLWIPNIYTYKGDKLLNKGTEIINTCRRRNKYELASCEAIDWRQIHSIRCNYNALF